MSVSFRLIDGLPIIDDMQVNGIRLTGVFDTGSNHEFSLKPKAIERLGLTEQASKGTTVSSAGYNGNAESRMGRVKSVKIGTASVNEPPMNFLTKEGSTAKEMFDLDVGNGFLQQFVVTFDYRTKVVTLEQL